MKPSYFAYVAFVGVLSFLMLFIVDRERKVGLDRLAAYRTPHSALDADPDLKLVVPTAHTCVPSVSGEHFEKRPQLGHYCGVERACPRGNRSPGPVHERLHLLHGKLAIFVAVHCLENSFVSRLKLLQ